MKTKLLNIKTEDDFKTLDSFMKGLGYKEYTTEDIDKEVSEAVIQVLNIMTVIIKIALNATEGLRDSMKQNGIPYMEVQGNMVINKTKEFYAIDFNDVRNSLDMSIDNSINSIKGISNI